MSEEFTCHRCGASFDLEEGEELSQCDMCAIYFIPPIKFKKVDSNKLNLLSEIKETSIIDNIDHPNHYKSDAKCKKCQSSIECIDIVELLNFNRGNTIKYIWRAGKKSNEIEDLKKALWYLDREIARIEAVILSLQ